MILKELAYCNQHWSWTQLKILKDILRPHKPSSEVDILVLELYVNEDGSDTKVITPNNLIGKNSEDNYI
jgi:hypothetical protein